MDGSVNSIAGILNGAPSQSAGVNGTDSARPLNQARIEGGTELSAPKKFEAMVMSQMVSGIMPKDSEYFGEGFSGDMWRSMMSEQIAEMMVKSADFGIAEMVAKSGTGAQKASK